MIAVDRDDLTGSLVPMNRLAFVLIAASLTGWFGPRNSFGQQDRIEQAREIIRDNIERRAQLPAAIARYRSDYTSTIAGKASRVQCEWTMAFDGRKVFGRRVAGNLAETKCQGCYRDFFVFLNRDGLSPNPSDEHAITVNNPPREPDNRYLLPDARNLGLFPASFYMSGYYDARAFLTPVDNQITVSSVTEAEEECLKIEYRNSLQYHVILWAAVARENSIVKAVSWPVQSPDYRETIRSRLAFDETAGTWYPTKVEYLRETGTGILATEMLVVEEFNTSRPEFDYSISSFEDARLNHPVNWLARPPKTCPEGRLVWNGRDIVCRVDLPEMNSGRTWRFWVFNLGLVALLSTVVFLFKKKNAERKNQG